MEFRTIVSIKKLPYSITHEQKIMMLGSCFAENIGKYMQQYKFNIDLNPFGILYNPASIAHSLYMLLQNKTFAEFDLFREGQLWHSFSHHSRFSHIDLHTCLNEINTRLAQGAIILKNADWLIITWGTAWVYRLTETGEIVSNCHKLPEKYFIRQRLCPNEITDMWIPLISELLQENPRLKILMTVSPVRHFRDGAHANQLSKSTLLLATELLCCTFSDNCFYFPSYEIVMDELRDYRFYDSDMVHPSEQAVEYIWEQFSLSCFSEKTRQENAEWGKIFKSLNHKPLTSDLNAYKDFVMQNLFKLKKFHQKYPYFDLSNELKSLECLLKSL